MWVSGWRPWPGIGPGGRWLSRRRGGFVSGPAANWSLTRAGRPRIAGLVCFRSERVDLTVDGQKPERPVAPWS